VATIGSLYEAMKHAKHGAEPWITTRLHGRNERSSDLLITRASSKAKRSPSLHRRPPRCRSRSAKACTFACISHQTYTTSVTRASSRKGDRREAVQSIPRGTPSNDAGDDWPLAVGKTGTAYAPGALRVLRPVTTLCSSRVLEMGQTKCYNLC